MHNLGLPDAWIDGRDEESIATHTAFLRYLAHESPELEDGQTFGRALDAPRFRLSLEPDRDYPLDDLFHNPFGVWHLQADVTGD